jgi:hypothetical protein
MYEENETGNPFHTNEGFQIQPLPKEIYGRKMSIKSVKKHKLLKEQSEAAKTISSPGKT